MGDRIFRERLWFVCTAPVPRGALRRHCRTLQAAHGGTVLVHHTTIDYHWCRCIRGTIVTLTRIPSRNPSPSLSKCRRAARTSTSSTRRRGCSSSIACCSVRSTTRPTTASFRAPIATMEIRSMRWSLAGACSYRDHRRIAAIGVMRLAMKKGSTTDLQRSHAAPRSILHRHSQLPNHVLARSHSRTTSSRDNQCGGGFLGPPGCAASHPEACFSTIHRGVVTNTRELANSRPRPVGLLSVFSLVIFISAVALCVSWRAVDGAKLKPVLGKAQMREIPEDQIPESHQRLIHAGRHAPSARIRAAFVLDPTSALLISCRFCSFLVFLVGLMSRRLAHLLKDQISEYDTSRQRLQSASCGRHASRRGDLRRAHPDSRSIARAVAGLSLTRRCITPCRDDVLEPSSRSAGESL